MNQCITARPLAELTLAPAAPASASSKTSCDEAVDESDAGGEHTHAGQADGERRPLAEAVGSSPQRRSVKIGPIQTVDERDPDLRQREVESSRSAGASTGGLISTAENAVAPAVPAARTAQR